MKATTDKRPTEAVKEDLRRRLRKDLRLTPGERLRLFRRNAGVTQAKAAKDYRVGRSRYQGWEEDIGEVPVVGDVPLTALSLGELCTLHRRRLGLTLEEMADRLGMRVTYAHWAERGRRGAERVVEFLEAEAAKEERDG